ncbi:PR domain zinc finger protein 5-like isoform X2 [Mercenaria mercenaria]|uniref:PR domain zinc finger protein 5-like isoform X2 n=1 Tax=Mercenaria mercenaria TaxID=6596 RepID=UPI00234FAE57|nr:PR domain zinc finger protein 5-like isoform X2 [Mercenaria mercenaria]
MAYQCETCGTKFQKLSQLLHHRRTENLWQKYTCPSCKKVFTRKDNLERHLKKHYDENNHHCPDCLCVFTRREALDEHFHQHYTQSGGAASKRTLEDNEREGVPAKRAKLTAKDNLDLFYDIKKITEKRIEKFKSTATYYKISFHDLEVSGLQNILQSLKIMFQSILDNVMRDISSTDLVKVSLGNVELDFPIVLTFMKRSQLTVERLLSEIERVLQSYEEFVLDDTLCRCQ